VVFEERRFCGEIFQNENKIGKKKKRRANWRLSEVMSDWLNFRGLFHKHKKCREEDRKRHINEKWK
jgi:hypothetical protein